MATSAASPRATWLSAPERSWWRWTAGWPSLTTTATPPQGLATVLDLLPHLVVGWERGLARQQVGHPLGLGFGQRHHRAERLEQSDEVEAVEVRWHDHLVERHFVLLGLEHLGRQERERDAVAGAPDDRVDRLRAAVREAHAVAVQPLDRRL